MTPSSLQLMSSRPSASDHASNVGRCFFGFSTLAFGVLQLVRADFVRLIPELPAWLPADSFWAGATGAILVAIGLSILTGRHMRLAASLLATLLLLSIAVLHLPEIATDPLRGYKWTNPCKALALFGGAALLSAPASIGAERPSNLAPAVLRFFPFGAGLLLSIFFIVGGIQHFVYANFVTELVPAWMPARTFWTYFTGIALITGGMGLLLPRIRRLAAVLCSLMIFLWVLLLHLPRAFTAPSQPGETDGVFEALAISGIALMLAARPPIGSPELNEQLNRGLPESVTSFLEK